MWEAEANELNAQEREALLISKIRQTLQDQLANLDQLHESLTSNGATGWEVDDVLEDDDQAEDYPSRA